MPSKPVVMVDGFKLPESPRWHDGELWMVDIFGKRVIRVTVEGNPVDVARTDNDEPSGLGFLPDGTPIVVLMWQREVRKITDGRLEPYADLSGLHPGERLNDMVVDPRTGHAFVDNTVRAPRSGSREDTGDSIVVVAPDGTARLAASGVLSPNGLALSDDGSRLYVAETRGRLISCLTVGEDGSLGDRRVIRETGLAHPDGICLDAEGAVWVSDGTGNQFVRIRPDGTVSDVIETGEKWALACCLGGPERNLLYLCTSYTDPARIAQRDGTGFLEVCEVQVPGAGTP